MTSTAEQNSQIIESVYDYLYIDQSRLSHIYAQLSNDGLISSSKRTSKNSDKSTLKASTGAVVFKGEYNNEEGAESGIEHQIDTSYSRPYDVLNALFSNNFLYRNTDQATLGSFVLFEGALSLMDFAMLKEMWPNIIKINTQNEAQSKLPKDREKFIRESQKSNEPMLDLVKHLPHLIQGIITSTDAKQFWHTLKPDCMLISSDDLILKHGEEIQGSWFMLGILDAFPDVIASSASAYHGISMAAHLRPFKEGIRALFGRPPHQFGITPIMVFKSIQKCE